MSNSKQLFDLTEFNKLHHEQQLSIIQIAEKYYTYPNKVSRLAKKLGAEIRNKSEAQKVAIQTGRQIHPTKGLKRTPKDKIKISEAVAKYWEQISNEDRNWRSNVAKEQWNNMSEEDRENLQAKAHEGVRKASKYGSKLELAILEYLISLGYRVEYHKKHMIANTKMHLDLLIPELNIVVEVDGPSHFQPIWGQDSLVKSKKADNQKDGLLLNAGFSIVRVCQKKDLTQKMVRDILTQLKSTLTEISTNVKNKKWKSTRIYIGD